MAGLRSLVTVLFKPRQTVRAVLDGHQSRTILPIVLTAIVSTFLSDVSIPELQDVLSGDRVLLILSLIVVGVVCGVLLGVGLFWLFSWLCHLAARFLGGTATTGDARVALAWGMVPQIWALLYRIPRMFLGVQSGPEVRMNSGSDWKFDPGAFSGGCASVAVFALLELTVLVWWVVTSTLALAEAEGISAGRAFGAIVITFSAPVIIIIAAVLAFAF